MPLPVQGMLPPPHGIPPPLMGIDDQGDIGLANPPIGELPGIPKAEAPGMPNGEAPGMPNGETPGMPKGDAPGMPNPEPGIDAGQLPKDDCPGIPEPHDPDAAEDQSPSSPLLRCLRPRSTSPIASIAPSIASNMAVPRSLNSAAGIGADVHASTRATTNGARFMKVPLRPCSRDGVPADTGSSRC